MSFDADQLLEEFARRTGSPLLPHVDVEQWGKGPYQGTTDLVKFWRAHPELSIRLIANRYSVSIATVYNLIAEKAA